MRVLSPGEEAFNVGLELEHDANTDVEAAEVVGHGCDVEWGSMRMSWQPGSIAERRGLSGFIVRDNLLKQPGRTCQLGL